MNLLFEKPYIRPISELLDDSDNPKLTAANASAIPYDGWVDHEVEFSLMSDETSKKIQVPLLVTSDSLDYPIIGYNVIDEFVTQQSDCNDPMIKSFKNIQPENVHALINFIQTPKQNDLCDVKTSKRDVTIPKKQSMKISCRVNTGSLEQKVPVLFEPSELEKWPAGLEVPEMLLSLKQGHNSIIHVKVFNPTDHDIVLRNRTEIGRLQLVRSVYPIEVKPADSNEADSQDQEEDVTSGESRKSEEVEELNKKGAKEQDCLGKCDGVAKKDLERNGVEDYSYEIEKSCNEKGKGISYRRNKFYYESY